MHFFQFVEFAGRIIKISTAYLKESKFIGNLDIRINLNNVRGEKLLYGNDHSVIDSGFSSIDEEITSRTIEDTTGLSSNFVMTITDLMKQVLWCFNCDQSDLEERVTAILKSKRLIE